MKKNRLLIILLVFLTVLPQLGAATIDEIVEGAKNSSPSYQNYVLTYENGLLNVASLEEEDRITVSVDTTVNPLMNSGTDEVGISVEPSVTVTLPNDGKTTITGGTSLSTRYRDGKTSISGEAGVSHTFDFSGYDSDNADNLQYTSTKYSTELTYKRAQLSFRKSVLNTISQVLSMENSISQSEYSVEKQQKALDKLNALGTYSTSSATYINTQNMLSTYQQSLEALKEQYSNLLSSYKTLTGLDWDGVEVGDAPELELVTYENGNTSVLIESLSSESSGESYRKMLAEANRSSLSTKLAVGAASSNYTVSGSVAYNSNNWSVSVTPSISITSSGKATPYVTIAGHWDNSTSSDSAVNSALNSAKMAANDYMEALSTYNQNAASYTLQILEYNNKKAEKKAELEYQEKLLANEQTLYSLGLSTADSLKGAELSYEAAETEWKLVVIEGLSLQCDLDIFAL